AGTLVLHLATEADAGDRKSANTLRSAEAQSLARSACSAESEIWVLACSTTIESMQARSTDPNDLQATVVITKLAAPSHPPLARQARIQGEVRIAIGAEM